jgi:uncharacterized protein (TIGR00369 family)
MDISEAMGRQIPFATHLGVELIDKGDGRARLRLEVKPELTNSFNAAHGGTVMTLLDIAMAVAARTRDPEALGAITIEMKASFMAPGSGTLTADGVCLHLGKSIAFCEARVHGSDGKLAATASGTFMLRHR